MFNLEQSIAEWRQQMLAAGIKTPVPLEELESHLRDDVEQQVRAGLSLQQAFETAIPRIGQAAVLEREFEKVGGLRSTRARAKQALFTLAGIPNHYLATPMNTSHTNLEPRWATYLKAATFLAPAVCIWTLAVVFVVPKLQQICVDADLQADTAVWNLTHSNITMMVLFREHGVGIIGLTILALAVLEWRAQGWPRYRRAAVGIGIFLLNSVVLVSIFIMILTATIAAASVLHHTR